MNIQCNVHIPNGGGGGGGGGPMADWSKKLSSAMAGIGTEVFHAKDKYNSPGWSYDIHIMNSYVFNVIVTAF